MNDNGGKGGECNTISDSHRCRHENRRVGLVLCDIESTIGIDHLRNVIWQSSVIESIVGRNRQKRSEPSVGDYNIQLAG